VCQSTVHTEKCLYVQHAVLVNRIMRANPLRIPNILLRNRHKCLL